MTMLRELKTQVALPRGAVGTQLARCHDIFLCSVCFHFGSSISLLSPSFPSDLTLRVLPFILLPTDPWFSTGYKFHLPQSLFLLFMLEMFLVTNPELRGSSLIAALILADPLKERGFDVWCFPPLLSWDFHLSGHLSALAQRLVCSFVCIKTLVH